jgi:hypothetical protein
MLGKRPGMRCWPVLAGALFFVTLSSAQEKQAVDPSSKVKAPPQNDKKLTLINVPRVSTEAAIRGAAQQSAKKASGDITSGQPEQGQVLEFRAVDSENAISSASAATQKKTQKGLLKNVHGTAYGAAGAKNPATKAEGAAVGASSKSSKTAIYVQTGNAQTSPPR